MLSFLFLKRTDSQGWFRNLVTVFAVTLASATLFPFSLSVKLFRAPLIVMHSTTLFIPQTLN